MLLTCSMWFWIILSYFMCEEDVLLVSLVFVPHKESGNCGMKSRVGPSHSKWNIFFRLQVNWILLYSSRLDCSFTWGAETLGQTESLWVWLLSFLTCPALFLGSLGSHVLFWLYELSIWFAWRFLSCTCLWTCHWEVPRRAEVIVRHLKSKENELSPKVTPDLLAEENQTHGQPLLVSPYNSENLLTEVVC